MPAQMLNENIFHAPNTEIVKVITGVGHLHAHEETVKNGENRANSHDPFHLSLTVLMLEYPAFAILIKY